MTKTVCIFMYHQVGEFAPMTTHRPTYCHYKNFRKQMAYLRRGGYAVLSLPEALAGLRGERETPAYSVALTFDDGYENFHEYAAPELQKHGFPATVFLVTQKIGGCADWLAPDGHVAAPLMDERQIRELKAAGVLFASHGRTHRRLSALDVAEARREVVESKAELEAMLGEPARYFCYPYGDYTPAAVEAVKEAGYEAALTCIRGRARPDDPLPELPRMAVSFGTTLPGYLWKLHFQKR